MKEPKIKDLIGKPIQRDVAYQMRLFTKALSEDIKKDVSVIFGDYAVLNNKVNGARYGGKPNYVYLPETNNYSKVRAYCPLVNSYLQFPRDLRKPGTTCICDIVSTENDKVGGFWRVIKGTVRKEGSDVVIA